VDVMRSPGSAIVGVFEVAVFFLNSQPLSSMSGVERPNLILINFLLTAFI